MKDHSKTAAAAEAAQSLLPAGVAQNAAAALRTIRRAAAAASASQPGSNSTTKRQLFQSPQLHLTIGLRSKPKPAAATAAKQQPASMLLALPNAVHSTATDSGCLITKDLPAAPADYEATAAHYAEQLRLAGCQAGLTVLPLRELTVAYMPYEAKRRLCAAYDYFLADRRIAHRLGSKLGAHFASKNRRKLPLPVDLEARDLAAEIERGRRTVRVCLVGSTLSCMVGQVDAESGDADDEEDKQLLDNVDAACSQLAKRLGLASISGLYLRHQSCGNVPIYTAPAAAAAPAGAQEMEQPITTAAAPAATTTTTKKRVVRDLDKDLAELGATLWDKDLLGLKERKQHQKPTKQKLQQQQQHRKKRVAFGKISASAGTDAALSPKQQPPASKKQKQQQQQKRRKPQKKQKAG